MLETVVMVVVVMVESDGVVVMVDLKEIVMMTVTVVDAMES